MCTPILPVDYALTRSEELAEVTATMIDYGLWGWVFRWAVETATEIQWYFRDDSIDRRPSWVLDPQIVISDFDAEVSPAAMSIHREGWTLSCDARCLGALCGSRSRPELQWNALFWDVCSSYKKVDEKHEEVFWNSYGGADHRMAPYSLDMVTGPPGTFGQATYYVHA